MAQQIPKRRFIARNPLGLWFCALSILGYLHVVASALRDPAFSPDAVDWVWLAGSMVLSVVGIALIVRSNHTRSL